jgi:hypothetical protein
MEEDTREACLEQGKSSAEQRPVGDRKRNVRVEPEHWQLQEQGESVPKARLDLSHQPPWYRRQ